MIDRSIVCFPNNIIEIVSAEMQNIDPHSAPDTRDGLRVIRRPIHPTDSTETVSVTAGLWSPDEDSAELGNNEPTVQRYTGTVEAMVKDLDEERGIATHSLLSALVRHTLYRDQALKVALPLLSVNLHGYNERLIRWGVKQQRFMNNKFDGKFYFLSAADLWFETAIRKV